MIKYIEVRKLEIPEEHAQEVAEYIASANTTAEKRQRLEDDAKMMIHFGGQIVVYHNTEAKGPVIIAHGAMGSPELQEAIRTIKAMPPEDRPNFHLTSIDNWQDRNTINLPSAWLG